MGNLEGKVALVTGGSSGIGREAVLVFAREGAKVVLASRGAEGGEEVAREVSELGGDATFVRADVSEAADVEGLVETAVSVYGRLDCAFNNAGSSEGTGSPTADFEEAEFERVVGTNLKGVWLCMKYEIRQMLRQEPAGGAIVNTSSVNGLGGAPGGALYSAAKSGVLALTKSAAQEYAPQGIRVNALVAGGFRTPMLEGVMENASGGDPEAREAVEARYEGLVPLGRIGHPEEAAEVAGWLCSPAASYVTGHSMIADGGATASVR